MPLLTPLGYVENPMWITTPSHGRQNGWFRFVQHGRWRGISLIVLASYKGNQDIMLLSIGDFATNALNSHQVAILIMNRHIHALATNDFAILMNPAASDT